MGLFNFCTKKLVGIDIGTARIKAVEISSKSNRYTIENYGMLDTNMFNFSAGQSILTEDEQAQAVMQLLKITNIKTKDVVFAIPSYPTFATTITMPYMSEEEISNTIQFEARKYIPVPLDSVTLNWSIISSFDAKTSLTEQKQWTKPSLEVLLIAVPKHDIQRYKNVAQKAGLKLRALELESFALIRSLVGNDLTSVCIVNIGARSTSILIIDNGYQRVSHDYEVGSFEITNKIAQALNVGPDRAEQLKRQFGMIDSEDNVIREAMGVLVDMMAFETKKIVENYEELKQKKVENVIVVGGVTLMPDFVKYFTDELGRVASLGSPTSRIIIPSGLESVRMELDVTFPIAIGLAMRKI